MIYKEEQLNNREFFEEIKEKAKDYIEYDYFQEAYGLARDLEQSISSLKRFKEDYSEYFHVYKEIITILRWVGLQIMPVEKIEEYFQNYFTKIFKINDYDFETLTRKLDAVLLGMMVFEERDKFKERLRSALLNNKEILTSKKLNVNSKEYKPTVGNWVRDYTMFLNANNNSKLARAQYLVNSSNTMALDSKEKEKIKLLINLYERLKLSSLTIEGVEEEIPIDNDDVQGIIKRGVFEPIGEVEKSRKVTGPPRTQEEKIIDALKEEEGKYADESLEKRAIEENIDHQKQIEELRYEANKYPVGSFERMAVEEEIKKLEK